MVENVQFAILLPTAAGLVAATVYLPLAGRKGNWSTGVLKTLPVALFALASLLAGGPVALTAALMLSAVGDLALSRSGRAAFLYGLAAFALAHVMLILCFQMLGDRPLWEAFALNPLAALALVLLALSTELWLAPHTGRLAWPVRGYVGLITAMGLAALTLPFALWPVTLGAGLFLLSDLILALRLFRMREDAPLAPLASRLLWAFYIAGQALILWGVLAA